MKHFVILALFAACASAQFHGYGGGYHGDPYAQPTPYSFGYEAPAIGGTHSRQESGDGFGRVQGSYQLQEADGRIRIVEYYADETGFHANVRTNELGTETSSAGTAHYESTAPTGPEAAALYDGHRAARAARA
jgi:hypothetical protein